MVRLEKKIKHPRKLEGDNGGGGGANYRKFSRGDTYSGSSCCIRDRKRSGRNPINGNGGHSKSNKKDRDTDSAFRSRLEDDIVANLAGIPFQDAQELLTCLRLSDIKNGKTVITKRVAAQCNSTFFGEAERIMRTLFSLARIKKHQVLYVLMKLT